MQERRDRLKTSILDKAFITSKEADIFSSDGTKINNLLDFRNVILNGQNLEDLAEIFWDLHQDCNGIQIAGLEIGAIPILTAIVYKGTQLNKDVRGLIIRKSKKKYGLQKIIEGDIKPDQPDIVVDDTFNSGTSLDRSISALADHGLKTKSCFVVVDFHSLRGDQWKAKGLPIKSIYRLSEFDKFEIKGPTRPLKNTTNFEIQWQFKSPGKADLFNIFSRSNPTVIDDLVLFAPSTGNVHALKLSSGELIWSYSLRSTNPKQISATPAKYKDQILIGGYNGDLACLETKTGVEKWRMPLAEYIGSSAEVDEKNGRAFVGLEFEIPGRQGGIACVDAETGKTIWLTYLPKYQHATPTYIPNLNWLAFGTNDHFFIILDAETGKELHRFPLAGEVKQKGFLDPKRNLFAVSTMAGTTHVFQLDQLKEIAVQKSITGNYASPLIVEKRLLVTSTDKCLYNFDIEKNILDSKTKTRSRIFSAPTFVGSSIFFGNNAGQLMEVNPLSMTLRGHFQLPDRIVSEVVFDPKSQFFLVHLSDGRIFCLRKIKAS